MAEKSIVTVTKKGQATIPKKLRERHKIGKKVLVIDTEDGVLLRPIPSPLDEKGSIKKFFCDTTSGRLIKEARSEEGKRDKRLFRASK
jgi:AbrB family looped-hinge helix DNA binding protein